MARRLLKFKANSDRTEILVKYEIDKNGAVDIVTLESTEKPAKALFDALQAMDKHMGEIAELPADWKLTILGVTVTNTNDVQGLVITATRELENSNAPLCLNTPHFTRQPYSEGDDSGAGIFSFRCAQALDRLEKLVFAYVDGDREQRVLNFDIEQSPVGATV